jgi:hypothetical protein
MEEEEEEETLPGWPSPSIPYLTPSFPYRLSQPAIPYLTSTVHPASLSPQKSIHTLFFTFMEDEGGEEEEEEATPPPGWQSPSILYLLSRIVYPVFHPR